MRMGIGLGVGINRSNYAQGIFSAYQSRVIADGGVTEAGACVDAVSGLLQTASLLLIPSGYKGGKLYAEIPTNGNGDLTWTRGGDAFRTNASGLLQRVPWNLLSYSEDFSNIYWSKDAGVTVDTNVDLAPNGTTTADRLNLSTNGAVYRSGLSFGTGSFTLSVWLKGEGANIGKQVLLEFTNGNSTVTLTGDWQRFTTTGTNVINVAIKRATSGQATAVLAWGIQVVEGTTAQTYLPTTDRLNFPRLSYMYGSCPAVLLEPQRTNSIRNSTMVGASTGVSGTNPTNWGALGTAGLTYEITSLGTENGVNYIDYKFSGTAAGSVVRVIFEGTAQIVASNGQTWTPSVYAKTISGTYDAAAIGLIQRNSVGGSLGLLTQGITLSSTLTRFATSQTVNQSLTAYVQPILDFYVTPTLSYNFTIRIAQPQMELGAYVTTPILTTGSASATRIADSFSRNNIYTNGLITSSGGTWFVELRGNVSLTRDNGNANLCLINNVTAFVGSGFYFRSTGTGRLQIIVYVAGVATSSYITTTDTTKVAIKWNGSTANVFANGTKVISAVTFTAVDLENMFTSMQVPTFIQQMALFPTPLSDTDCTTLTT